MEYLSKTTIKILNSILIVNVNYKLENLSLKLLDFSKNKYFRFYITVNV